MPRKKIDDQSPQKLDWYCVLDRDHRLLYLGNEEKAARAALTPGAVIRKAARMGDAQSAAAIAVSEERRGEQ